MAMVSKVVLGNGTVVMDISQDTVAADKLLTGYTAHGADGEAITGTCDYDVDSSDCTASVGEVLSGETFAAGGSVLTGTMPNRGAVNDKTYCRKHQIGHYNFRRYRRLCGRACKRRNK